MEEITQADVFFVNLLHKRVLQWALRGMVTGIIALYLLLLYLVFTHAKPVTGMLLWDVVIASVSGAYVGGFLGAVCGYLSIAFPYGWARTEDERWRVLLSVEGGDDSCLE